MKINLAKELTRLDPRHTREGLRHLELKDFDVDGDSMLGLALLEGSASPDHWEVHDGGDELLVVISGTIRVEVANVDESQRQTLSAGECICPAN